MSSQYPGPEKHSLAKVVAYVLALASVVIVWGVAFLLNSDGLMRVFNKAEDASLFDMLFFAEMCGWTCITAYWSIQLAIQLFRFRWLKAATDFWARQVGIAAHGLVGIFSVLAGLGHILELHHPVSGALRILAGVVLIVVSLVENRRFKRQYNL